MASSVTAGTGSFTPSETLPPRRSRSRVVLWTVGILVIGGMLVAVFLPSLCQAREPANRVKCASNLRQIGQAIATYAHDHGGHYPPSLAVLMKTADLTPAVLICPSSNDTALPSTNNANISAELAAAESHAAGHEHNLSYIYTGSAFTLDTTPATAVVLYEPLDNHEGNGTNVLFGDGHVE